MKIHTYIYENLATNDTNEYNWLEESFVTQAISLSSRSRKWSNLKYQNLNWTFCVTFFIKEPIIIRHQ
jgi:hypothetical protein